jgi:hypothetical protein
MFWNSRERALSSDNNRSRAFLAADDAEEARWRMSVRPGSDDLGIDLATGGWDQQFVTLTSPASGEVIGGLLVRPQLGSSGNPLGIIIDPGVAHIIAPDGDADASVYKRVRDPGIQTLGALNFAPGGGGGTRIDLVCATYVNAVAETSSRDVYDPATGLFTPTALTKALQGKISYTVVSGAVGGGVASALAAVPAGAVPLMVAVVPNAAANNDGMTYYDVRPMVHQRSRWPFNLGTAAPAITYKEMAIDSNGAGNAFLTGRVEGDAVVDAASLASIPCRVGGTFSFSVPAGPDLSTAEFQSGGAPASGLAFVYLALPNGLPNWRKYSPASAGSRIPLGVRGVILISNVGPNGPLNRSPSAPLPLPTASGLGGSTQAAMCVAMALVVGGVIQPLSSDGRFDYPNSLANGWSTGVGALVGSVFTFTLHPNGATNALGYAASARSLRIALEFEFTVATVSNGQIQPTIAGKNTALSETFFAFPLDNASWDNRSGGNLTWNKTIIVDVPVPTGNGASAWKLVVDTAAASGATASLATATIVGVGL